MVGASVELVRAQAESRRALLGTISSFFTTNAKPIADDALCPFREARKPRPQPFRTLMGQGKRMKAANCWRHLCDSHKHQTASREERESLGLSERPLELLALVSIRYFTCLELVRAAACDVACAAFYPVTICRPTSKAASGANRPSRSRRAASVSPSSNISVGQHSSASLYAPQELLRQWIAARVIFSGITLESAPRARQTPRKKVRSICVISARPILR
jgi:hypothetical protein